MARVGQKRRQTAQKRGEIRKLRHTGESERSTDAEDDNHQQKALLNNEKHSGFLHKVAKTLADTKKTKKTKVAFSKTLTDTKKTKKTKNPGE
jgi:hypothetical protein